jgi:hypothetical protein
MTVSKNIYHKRQPKVARQCKNCTTTFTVWASLLRHGKRCDFCSRTCFEAASRVTVTCDFCGKVFERQRATASRYLGKNFCSRACNNKARRKDPERIAKKQLRYGSAEFQKARKEVLERDGVCQICSSALANSVHHKNWDPYDNRLENLVLLCRKCHGGFRVYEEWESAKLRIKACSGLMGNYESSAEMPELPSKTSDGITSNENRLEVCI